jgi:DNA topoisomerase-1
VLREGEALALDGVGVVVSAKATEPPPYYSEASLVKKLEEEGIGRPSTYAEIISKVQARDYVRKDGGKLVPSDLGRLVVERLVGDGFDLADLAFTRKLEEDLDAVAEARAKRLDILAPFHQRLQRQIEKSLGITGKWWPDPEEIGEACPECGKPLYKRWGRNGQFIGCTGYPECKYTRPLVPPGEDGAGGDGRPEMTDMPCKECGAPLLKRLGRNGWFLGCSTYPKCKYTRNPPLGVNCPKCGGEIVEIRGRNRRRPFYGCTNYNSPAKCDYRLWQRPVPEKCPRCHAAFLVHAGNANNPMLRCVTEGCGHQQAVAPRDGEDGGAPGDEQPLRPTGSGQG